MAEDDFKSLLGDLFSRALLDEPAIRRIRPPGIGLVGGGDIGGPSLQAIRSMPVAEPRYPGIAKSEMMDAYKGLWEMVPVDWLRRLPGNALRNPVDELRASIAAQGVQSPLIINAGKNSRTAQLGEGNHRLAAIRQLGFTHAPARVIVGGEWGKDKGYNVDQDLIPQRDTYFSSDAPPSQVFRSLPREPY